MGGLASESRPWLDQFMKRDKERDCKGFSSGKKNLYSLFLIQRKKGEEEKKNYKINFCYQKIYFLIKF